MSKEISWSEIYGEGTIECLCDYCQKAHEVEFEDNRPDYKGAQAEIRKLGWVSIKIGGEWFDFCCEGCRNQYIKENY